MKKQLTPHSSLKIARVITGTVLLAFIGIISTLQASDTNPEPSPSVGGRTVSIVNNTKYNIVVKDLVMRNPHHDDGKSYDLGRTIPAHSGKEVLGPSDNCSAGKVWYTSSCFWGAKDKSDKFNISSKNFPDPNKTYEINISRHEGTIPLDLKERDRDGYCTYSILKWKAVWKGTSQEITFDEDTGRTSRQEGICKK